MAGERPPPLGVSVSFLGFRVCVLLFTQENTHMEGTRQGRIQQAQGPTIELVVPAPAPWLA